jgi:cytochrome c oxidase subunit 2
MPVVSAGAEQVIKITAKKFEYSPDKITLKKGVPVTLSLVSLDQLHGFNCPGLNIRSDIAPEKVSTIRFTPEKSGTFDFHCDVFCGSGHDQMTGTITVTE